MPKFSGEYGGSEQPTPENNEVWDPGFCNAYGKCDDSCLIFGCAFEEMEKIRNWDPDHPEIDDEL